MSLKSRDSFQKNLAFAIEKKWPQALLPLGWREELLCGFSSLSPSVWELDETSELSLVAEVFLEVHNELSFLDLLLLQRNAQKISWGRDFFSEVLRQLSGGQSLQWLKLLENLENLPTQLLLKWQEKRLQFGDLRPLLSLDCKAHHELWSILTPVAFSKSEWSQVIEWFTELLLMDKTQELKSLSALQASPKELLLKIKELRYPETTKRDRLEMDFWKKLPWPKNTQAEFRRSGDQTKTYVSMNFSSLQDLKKLSQDLQKMTEQQELGK